MNLTATAPACRRSSTLFQTQMITSQFTSVVVVTSLIVIPRTCRVEDCPLLKMSELGGEFHGGGLEGCPVKPTKCRRFRTDL